MGRLAPTFMLAGVLTLSGLAAATAVGAAENTALPTPDVLAPESLRYCVTCHGVELQGNRLVDAPRLAGLPHWYLERQMQAFRAGWRGAHAEDRNGMEMRPQAVVLNAAELNEALDFAVRVPVRGRAPVTVAGDAARGRDLYAGCIACHGTNGEGNESLSAPPLAGQNDWYLVTQLQNFRTGARGAAAGDTQGALMGASVAVLADDTAVADVVAYITTLEQSPQESR